MKRKKTPLWQEGFYFWWVIIMSIIQYGLYNALDEYFETFSDKNLCDNKMENRPYYCAIVDKDDIIWLIPLSTQIESYTKKIQRDEEKYGRGNCLFYHKGNIYKSERVFLIGNMFPVTETYIKKPHTFEGNHYIIGDQNLIRELHTKSQKYLRLVMNGKLRPNVDIMRIKALLIAGNKD
jgi:hypothetical protein